MHSKRFRTDLVQLLLDIITAALISTDRVTQHSHAFTADATIVQRPHRPDTCLINSTDNII